MVRLEPRIIAVIGAGLMGHGICQVFAQFGYEVHLVDVSKEILDGALAKIRGSLEKLSQYGLIDKTKIEGIISRIATTTEIKEAGKDADFVVEAVVENLEVKKKVFSSLDESCPSHTILASNTSGIPISAIASATKRPSKVVGTHFWNPPTLIQAVEIVRGDETSDETVKVAKELLRSVGKKPVVVNKDVPGQIGIRILYAMIREAVALVEKGIATPEDVDTVIKEALGTRLSVLGVLDLVDLSGVDLMMRVANIVFKDLDDSKEAHKMVKEMVERGELGLKSGKGFYDWSKRSADEVIRIRDEHLIKVLKERGLRIA